MTQINMKEVFSSLSIEKATASDKREILRGNLRSKVKLDNKTDDYMYLQEYDDEYAYFEVYSYDTSSYHMFRIGYIFNGTSAEFSDTIEQVVRTTTYEVVAGGISYTTSEDLDKSLTDKVVGVLDKYFGGSKKEDTPVIKQFNEEEMVSYEPIYIPAGDVDLHGDTISLEDTHGLVESINKAVEDGRLQSGIAHKHKTESFSIVKAWVNEMPCVVGETEVPEGQPIAKVQFHNEQAWNLRKSGELQGLSIGARAREIEVLDE